MTRFLPFLRRFARSDRGTATVEFVIGVPLILAFLFSAIDYGTVMAVVGTVNRAGFSKVALVTEQPRVAAGS